MKLTHSFLIPFLFVATVFLAGLSDLSAQGIESELTTTQKKIIELQFEQTAISKLIHASMKQLELMEREHERVASMRQTLLNQQDESGISEESFPELLKILQSQRVQLMIDLAGIEARQTAIEHLKTVSVAERKANNDSLKQMLSEVVKNNEERLAQLRQLGQEPSMVDEQELLGSKIQLAELETRGSDEVKLFNDESLNTALEKADKQARLKKAVEMLKELVAARSKIDEIGQLERRQSAMEPRRFELFDKIQRLEFEKTTNANEIERLEANNQEDH